MASEIGRIAVVDFSSNKPKILKTATARYGDDEQQKPSFSAIAVNDDGNRLIFATAFHLLVLELQDGSSSEIDTGREAVSDAYLSGDGRRLMVLTEAGAVLTWTLPTPGERITKPDQAGRVASEKPFQYATLSRDGRLVLAAARDGSLLLSDVSSASPSVTLAENLRQVRSVSLSTDARYAAASTDDGVVHIWDVSISKGPTIQFKSFAAIPLAAQIDRGNQSLITTFENGSVVKSPLHMDNAGFAAQVIHNLTRCLSQAQRQVFGLVFSEQETFRPSDNIATTPDASGHCRT
jgi:WD40 repeat protein